MISGTFSRYEYVSFFLTKTEVDDLWKWHVLIQGFSEQVLCVRSQTNGVQNPCVQEDLIFSIIITN